MTVTESPTAIPADPRLQAGCPTGPDRGPLGPAQVRHEAGQPGQQAQVRDHRGRHRAWPAPRPPPRWPSSATR